MMICCSWDSRWTITQLIALRQLSVAFESVADKQALEIKRWFSDIRSHIEIKTDPQPEVRAVRPLFQVSARPLDSLQDGRSELPG